MKAWTNTLCQNCLSGKDIMVNSVLPQKFLQILSINIYLEVNFLLPENFLKFLFTPSCMYCKREKIRWTKLSHFSRFSGVLQKFFCEYKRLSLSILNNEHLWLRQHESISAKTSMVLKPQIFSPVNLSPSTVWLYV